MPPRLVGTGGDGDSHGSCFPARLRFPFQSSDDPFQQIVTARSDQGQARASRVLLTRQERIELGQKRIQAMSVDVQPHVQDAETGRGWRHPKRPRAPTGLARSLSCEQDLLENVQLVSSLGRSSGWD